MACKWFNSIMFTRGVSHLFRVLLVIIFTSLSVSAIAAKDSIRLATTTSTYNSGLLDHLLSRFQHQANIEVQVIAVGTGKALRMGENGDVDLVMTHAPAAEAAFVAAGFGLEPQSVMYNDFIIVGPKDDPLNLVQYTSVGAGMRAIANAQARFISRGDDSGTHKKERNLWQAIGVTPAFSSYLESGRGMGHTLYMASELSSYTLTDRGTWLALRGNLDLAVLLEEDPLLKNPYQVILINPERHAHVKISLARRFVEWLVGVEGQAAIGAFRVDNQQLFVPSATSDLSFSVEPRQDAVNQTPKAGAS